jgi:hypothetical protein
MKRLGALVLVVLVGSCAVRPHRPTLPPPEYEEESATPTATATATPTATPF